MLKNNDCNEKKNKINLDNPALIKEWKKIEFSNIFDSFESFAAYYYQNGEGECFRKYTADPWSKENFFFGSYNDLLEYYKNDLTIPNSIKQKIGMTFNYLTVLDFIAERINNKKVIFAKCQCVCGQLTIKRWDFVRDGKIKSCGCKNPRNKETIKISDTEAITYWDYDKNTENPKNVSIDSVKKYWWKCSKCGISYLKAAKSFAHHISKFCPNCSRPAIANIKETYPELVEEEWDYEKNSILPEECPIDCLDKIWWSPKYGKPFQATISERTKSLTGTSFEEQAIYFYIKKIFPDAENRKQLVTNTGTLEIDIFIPCLSLAIEYDGSYWHKYKGEKDTWKNNILKQNHIHLIRVRETGLTDLIDNYGDLIYRKTSNSEGGLHIYEVVTRIFSLINSYINNTGLNFIDEILQKISSFRLSKEKLILDRQKIYCQYKTAYQKDNIAKSCLMKYWDFQKNGDLLPSNVKYNDRLFIWFKCLRGFQFQTRPSYINIVKNCFNQKQNCDDCYANICPFYSDPIINGCPDNEECEFSILAQNCKNATYHTTKWIDNKIWEEAEKAIDEIENANHEVSFEKLNRIFLFKIGEEKCGKLVYRLYKSGKLEEYHKKGRFDFRASINFIQDKNIILDIFELCGVSNFVFLLSDFDEPLIRERFFDILKHQFNNSYYYSLNENTLEKLIKQQIHMFSKPFLLLLLDYLKFTGTKFETGWHTFIDLPECRNMIEDKLSLLGTTTEEVYNVNNPSNSFDASPPASITKEEIESRSIIRPNNVNFDFPDQFKHHNNQDKSKAPNISSLKKENKFNSFKIIKKLFKKE